MPMESENSLQLDASVGLDASEVLSTTAKSELSRSPGPCALPEAGEVEQEPAQSDVGDEASEQSLNSQRRQQLKMTYTLGQIDMPNCQLRLLGRCLPSWTCPTQIQLTDRKYLHQITPN